ncbi:MAG TPA: non-ribosomal peptide synthetase, partial [Anaerolineae bacterium]|nr:non-ribosomal peptide synthetase [Anaerolineae bacterium]
MAGMVLFVLTRRSTAVCKHRLTKSKRFGKSFHKSSEASMTLENFVEETQLIEEDGEDVFVFPVSFAQQRLWFLDQFEPNSPYYNIPIAVRLHGRLQPAILENVLNEIVQRHEILRTTFGTVDGEPVQIIAPDGYMPLPLLDLRHLPPEEREQEALRLANEEAKRPFNLTTGPLFRAHLYQLSDDEFVAIFVMHHIISDGWSIGVLMQEITALYDAFAAGRPSPLPDLPIQYADFAHWQREWLQGEALEGQLVYWQEKLGSQPPILELPTDRPRPAVQTSRGATTSHTLPPELMTAVNKLCRETGVTQFMALLAAFQVLLYRYSSQTTINVGSPIANRTRGEIEGLIGFFINTLVLRADLDEQMSFRELLAQVKETTLEAYAHQDLPFEMLVEAIQPERDMSHSPLFQVMFILQNAPARAQELPDLRLEMIDVETGTATFDITLSLAEWGDGGMDASMEFNTDLFDRATIERMLTHYETLLRGIIANPDTAVSHLPLLPEEEERQILVEWNDTARPYPLDQCVHQLFEAQAKRTPQATAVVWQDEQLTYAQLNQRANQ